MVPVSSSRTVTAQRPGSEAMISEIHRQSSVGMPTTARATMPLSGCEEYAPVEVGLFAPGKGYRARLQLPTPIQTPLTADVARLECLVKIVMGFINIHKGAFALILRDNRPFLCS